MKTSETRATRPALLLAISLALGLAACGGDDDGACDPAAQTGCDDGQVCELVEAGEPACFPPLVVRGDVFELGADRPIAGARIVALDPGGAPASQVARSDDGGGYQLAIPSQRTADGTPLATTVTLRADAAGYQTFPGGVRLAQPIDTAAASRAGAGEPWVVQSAQTDLGLLGFADAGAGVIAGTVEVTEGIAGVLVVAEAGGVGTSAIADRSGDYAIFNLPAGDYTVDGYARGVSYAAGAATLADGDDAVVDLALSAVPTATVSGNVNIVNPGDGEATSVILVVESTFSDKLGRGASPPGLRTPLTGPPSVTGAFDIEGVPDGRYVVLAGFENDALVRDPDTCIAGTEIVHIEIAGGDRVLDQSFKITGALAMLAPAGPEPAAVEATPVFSWTDDSSEDDYQVVVIDSFGQEVWSTTVPGASGADPEVTYGGPALEAGMYYQVRVLSRKMSGGGGGACELSASEDLAGVFYLP